MTRPRSIRRRVRRYYLRGRRIFGRLARSTRFRRSAAAAVILAVAFAVGAWGVLPYAVAYRLESWAGEHPGRAIAAARIGVNPFTLAVTLDDVSVTSELGEAHADRVVVDSGVATLLGRHTVLDALRVRRPSVRLTASVGVLGDALVERIEARALRIDRVEIRDGSIEGAAGPGGDTPRLRGVTLTAASVDSASAAAAPFAVVVDDLAGGALEAEGELRLSQREVSGRLELKAVDAGVVLGWLGHRTASGIASGSARLRWLGAVPGFELSDLALRVSDARFAAADGIAADAVELSGSAALRNGGFAASGRMAFESAVLGSDSAAPWLVAERLEAASLSIDLRPSRGTVWADELVLIGPRAGIVLNTEALGVLREGAAAAAAGSANGAATASDGSDRSNTDSRALDLAIALLRTPRPEDTEFENLAARGGPDPASNDVGGGPRLDASDASGRSPSGMDASNDPGRSHGVSDASDDPARSRGVSDAPNDPSALGGMGELPSDSNSIGRRSIGLDGASVQSGVGQIMLQRGEITLFDERLVPDVELRFVEVEGALSRSDEPERAIRADLEGRIAGEGRIALALVAEVGTSTGSSAPRRSLALQLAALPATLLSPYAERLAGVALEGGSIDAEIDYRLGPGEGSGFAEFRSRGLTLADTGDERLRLGLALLEDPQREAAANIRLEGADAGLPEVLAAAVSSHLHRVAEDPFSALAAAVGAVDEIPSTVPFAPGNASPAGPGAETIERLAEALHARPGVGIRILGTASPAIDRDALAAAQVELHVTLATAGPVVVARPRPVDFDSPRHRDILDEFSGERLSAEQRETIASYFTRDANGRVVEPEQSEYYRALFEALVEHESIPESALERLARFRARAIADALESNDVAPERIDVGPPFVGEPEWASAGRLDAIAGEDAPSANASSTSAPAHAGTRFVSTRLEASLPREPAASEQNSPAARVNIAHARMPGAR